MRILLSLILLVSPPSIRSQILLPISGGVNASSGGGGGCNTFSDNFDRANGALGANWSQWGGTADINSNSYRLGSGSFANITSVYTTSTNCTTQYVRFTTNAAFSQYPWIAVRGTNSSSGYYTLQLDGASATVEWYYFANASASSGTQIGSTQMLGGGAFGAETFCVTITGTGTSTVVRVWRGCTNTPSAADNWDGDTTPNVTFTDDPGTAVDSGGYVGIGGQQGSANTNLLDNFFGGGLS